MSDTQTELPLEVPPEAPRLYFDAYHPRPSGALNREYLRICAVYRLLKRKHIGKAIACELLARRNVENPARLVALWRSCPIPDMLP